MKIQVEIVNKAVFIEQSPLLMLTALGDEAGRVVGLEFGADDYLPRTFSTRAGAP